MHLVGILLAIVLAVVGFRMILRAVHGGSVSFRSAGSRLPCATCVHCRKLFDDGSLCSFEGRETFKNEIHIGNCIDWKQRPRKRGAS